MKDEPRATKHQLNHAIPTVIHHPEEDMGVLARWVHQAMEDQTRFWTLIVGVVVVVVGLTVLASGLSLGRAASDEAWTELELAKTAKERVEVAKKYPNTPAERWALLQAATEYYNKGFADLPSNREVALPDLKQALNYFEQVAQEADKDTPQARAAAFGVARTHEARNDLEKAIAQYEYVAKTWPDSDEGRQSKELAELLRKPEAVTFYKELYAYKPTDVTLPPMGDMKFPLPPGHPAIDSPLMLPPPPPTSPAASLPTKETVTTPTLPGDIFAAPPAPVSKDTTTSPSLPEGVFAPAPPPSKQTTTLPTLPEGVFAPDSEKAKDAAPNSSP